MKTIKLNLLLNKESRIEVTECFISYTKGGSKLELDIDNSLKRENKSLLSLSSLNWRFLASVI